MKAVLYTEEVRFVTDYPAPEPAEGEALIRVLMAGICNTDLEIIKGYAGFRGVLGHEFVGRVIRVNSEDQSLAGKRVVGEINCGCGKCSLCLDGHANHCAGREVLGIVQKQGALAEYITLPLGNLLVVPEHVPDEEAVFAEPLAAAFRIPSQVRIVPGARTAVLGDRKLGLLCAMVLKLCGADLTLVGKHGDKLGIAEANGIKTVMFGVSLPEKSYEVIVEATGSSSGMELAIRLVRPLGTIILKSTVASASDINLSPIVIDEITVVGSRCGPFKPALQALADRTIDVRPLISGIYRFEQAEAAFRHARESGSLKILIDFR